MKNVALKRWIFTALLLALIAGTIVSHANVVRPDQNQIVIAAEPPAVLAQTMDEIAKRTKSSEDGALAGPGDTTSPGPVFLPLCWRCWPLR